MLHPQTNESPAAYGKPPVVVPRGGLLRHLVITPLALVGAWALYVAHEHWAAGGDPTRSLLALGGSALLVLVPVRAVLGAIFRLEAKLMHMLHGVGGLALIGLAGTGVISSGPLLTHAALAPFAIMGAAQAVMHQHHPRNAQQAQALRRFASSLPEVEQFTRNGSLATPENAARAVVVLRDLIAKAEALGYTELDADPGFQSALRQATTRFGLTLALDQMQKVVTALAGNPATAGAVPDLQARLAKARSIAAQGARPLSTSGNPR